MHHYPGQGMDTHMVDEEKIRREGRARAVNAASQGMDMIDEEDKDMEEGRAREQIYTQMTTGYTYIVESAYIGAALCFITGQCFTSRSISSCKPLVDILREILYSS